MDHWTGLESFLRVAKEGSFSRAADALGVPRSTVSRRVARLEDDLGRTLLERDTRNVHLTEAGRLVLERGKRMQAGLHALEAELAELEGDVAGVLRIAVPVGLAEDATVDFHHRLLSRHPLLRIVQQQTDLPPHLLVDDYDVIIAMDGFAEEAWVARPIAPADRFVVATSSYLGAFGVPLSLSDLDDHRVLAVHTSSTAPVTWPLCNGGRLGVDPVFRSNDVEVVRRLMLSDHGLALLPRGVVLPELAAGGVQRVLVDEVGEQRTMFALHSPQSRRSRKVAAFFAVVDEVVAEAAGMLRAAQLT